MRSNLLLLFLLSISVATKLNAQCSIEQNNQNAVYADGVEIGNSFVATIDGAIESITYYINSGAAPGTDIMTLHQGDTGLNPLGSVSYSVPTVGAITATFASPIPVTAGQTYTFMVNPSQYRRTELATGNHYANGLLLRNDNGTFNTPFSPDIDYKFQIKYYDPHPAPVFTNLFGDGTIQNPFTTVSKEVFDAAGVGVGHYYFNFNGSTFQGTVDNVYQGGGWLLVLNYVHQAGTNPNLQVRNTDLPLLDLASPGLGDNQAGTPYWGHIGNTLAAAIDFEEMRFIGVTSRDTNDYLHFATDYTNAVNYVKTGLGSFSGINNPSNYTLLTSHAASLPQNAPDFYIHKGDYALTEFPFWRSGDGTWGIRGDGHRWEVDDVNTTNAYNTVHQVFVRGDLSPTYVPREITIQLNEFGLALITTDQFGITAVDNCGDTVTHSLSQTTFNCSNIGVNTIQYMVTDEEGNTNSVDVIVNVNGVTNAILENGNVTVTDLDSNDDDYIISVEGTNYKIENTTGNLIGGPGIIQNCDHILVPIASVTGAITIDAQEGNDNLNIDFILWVEIYLNQINLLFPQLFLDT